MNTPTHPVLQVLVSTRPGGGPRHVLDLSLGLRARGWQPLVAGPADGAYVARFREAAIDIASLATDRAGPRAVLGLLSLARRRGVRLIHSHGKGAGLHARLAARVLGIPAVHTFHGIHFEQYGRFGGAAYIALERCLSRWTAAVIHVSCAQEAEARALRLGPVARSHVVINGIDIARVRREALERGEARRRLGLDPQMSVVGSVARLDEVKRLDVLVRAVAQTAQSRVALVLVGGGPEEARLRSLVSTLGLQGRVSLTGEVPDGAGLLRAFDLYATSSRKEGMPLAVVEAMALGLPVVASDIPAHREILGPCYPVFLRDGPECLARTIDGLLDDAMVRQTLGEQNRARAEKLFDAERMVDGVEAVYRAVLGLA